MRRLGFLRTCEDLFPDFLHHATSSPEVKTPANVRDFQEDKTEASMQLK